MIHIFFEKLKSYFFDVNSKDRELIGRVFAQNWKEKGRESRRASEGLPLRSNRENNTPRKSPMLSAQPSGM